MAPGRYTYSLITLDRVVDGDTLDLTVQHDVGFHLCCRYTGRFRIVTVNTPERGQDGFAEATAYTRNWLENRLDSPIPLTVTTYRDPDNFGRYLADIFTPNGDSLASALLRSGHAVPFSR